MQDMKLSAYLDALLKTGADKIEVDLGIWLNEQGEPIIVEGTANRVKFTLEKKI